MAIQLQLLQKEEDIQRVINIEAASYPSDEAASSDNIRYRQQHAGSFFSIATLDGEIVGFVNGTLVPGEELSEESMSIHDPNGRTLCIHSVCVDAAHRRKGIASQMFKQYVSDICEKELQVDRIVLIAKAHLVGFYVSCGFTVTKLSSVVHGKDPWFELALDCIAARRLPVVQVDAFTSELFEGNPAAVVVMPPSLFHKSTATQWMQRVALENHVSNTAYVSRRPLSESAPADIAEFDLRWFTPKVEVALCGHATLASAFVLYDEGHVSPSQTIHFHTLQSGVLVIGRETVSSVSGEEKHLIHMSFPRKLLLPKPDDLLVEDIARGLNISPSSIIAVNPTENTDIQVHIETSAFPAVQPDLIQLAKIVARGIVVTAQMPPNEDNVDFQSRFFAPRIGLNEDPVTGSAHCALSVYWGNVLKKSRLYAKQASPERGGYMTLELLADQPARVLLKGEAVISLRDIPSTTYINSVIKQHIMAIQLQLLQKEEDTQRVINIEAASYPSDEAASSDNIRYRQQHAGSFFSIATLDGEIVGFVNGTLVPGEELSEESMSIHDPNGRTLCIHSVCVDAAHRRKGIASQMFKQYVSDICEKELQVDRIVLIAKAHLVGFYVSCGFTVTKLSSVVHGKDPWFELALDCIAARRLPVVQVDAFTSELFEGNPAAVVVMPPSLFHKSTATQWMQRVALENNLSETAYVSRRPLSESAPADIAEFDLRWFTPKVEVALCGHATLASAFTLFENGSVTPSQTIHFHTLSGVLIVGRETVSSASGEEKHLVRMNFPRKLLLPQPTDLSRDELARGLGISPSSIITINQTQNTDLLVHIEPFEFSAVQPDFVQLAKVDARGIIVTAQMPPNEANVDFQSRFFAPSVGVNEDPVTGSAHCALSVYWGNVLKKSHLYAKQASPERGGYMTLELLADQPARVLLKGEAVISLRGTLMSAP